VLTLLIISMLVVVVVGFTSVTRLEQIAARNATYQTAAQQMAQLATGRAMQRLSEAVTAGVTAGIYATQPGALHPRGVEAQPLYSTNGTAMNINSLTASGFVTGNAADNIEVSAEDVLSDNGQVIGRTAFYISDDTAKLPVNRAAPQRASLNPAPPRPFSVKGVDDNLPAAAASTFSNILAAPNLGTNTISNWNYFFTPEQLAAAVSGIGPVRARRVTVATDSNRAPPTTPWGAPKILINQLPLVDASVDTLVAALTNQELTEVFGGHFGDKYGEQGVRQLAANMLQLRSDHWRTNALFQGTNTVLGTEELSGSVSALPESGMLKKTNGIPQEIFGYVPFPMLSEIGVSFAYGWEATDIMTVRIYLECELFNPFPTAYPGGGQIYAQIDKARFLTTYAAPAGLEWRGPNGTSMSVAPHNDMSFGEGQDPWGSTASGPIWWGPPGANTVLDPPQGFPVAPVTVPSVPPGDYATATFQFDVRFAETNPAVSVSSPDVFVIIDQVKILAQSGDPASIRDWCSGNDLFNALAGGAQGPAQFVLSSGAVNGPFGSPTAPVALPPTPPGQVSSIVKIDPRMRPPTAASQEFQTAPPGRSWMPAATATIGLPNAIGPAAYQDAAIPADPAFSADLAKAVFNPDNPPALALPSGNYTMAADLGKVFTGMPWRTLRMQPQPVPEIQAALIPDWVLLDMVDFTSGNTALGSVNPNVRYASSGASVVGFGSGVRSLLDVLTNSSAARTLADPITTGAELAANAIVPTGFTNNQSGISNMIVAASQPDEPVSWSAGQNGWLSRRETLGFPTNALLLPSEIAEIDGFADYVTADTDRSKENELRLAALFPGLATKGRFFTIHAVGQALEGGTNAATPVSTVLLETLVEVDDSTTPVSVRTILQRTTPN